MAKRKTAQEFIQDSFSPAIAVLCAPKVDSIVCKNNLSFAELLQPFAGIESEGQFREPNGTVCVVKHLKYVIRDVNWKPLQPIDARRLLNNAVQSNYNDNTVLLQLGNRKFNLPQCTLWFDAWRETYFEVQFPSDHEFTKHFIACMLIGTTLDDNIVETFNNLNQQFSQYLTVAPPKLPKWFNSNILKSYVLLHDVSCVPQEKAMAMFENMKQNFDANHCYMLSINSRSTTDPLLTVDYWSHLIKRTDTMSDVNTVGAGAYTSTHQEQAGTLPHVIVSDTNTQMTLSTNSEIAHPLLNTETEVYDNANSLQTHSYSGSSESVHVAGRVYDPSTEVHGAALNAADIEEIKKFMQDYTSRGLLPYIERQVSLLTDAVSNRKGVSRSLLSATKRWFGTGKGGNNTGNNTVIYTSECGELQLRRLGDLWFMAGQWARAFDAYHTAKREFHADGAWLCYAGALEMAALSAFMAGDASRKTNAYMDESILTYLNTCRMVQFAVRATLLSALCLSSEGQPGEAAKQLIRMTSEDSDLRSAVLLEQAALCFLQGPPARAMPRKYAFHMVLAGHRFSKAGQKKHAYRCYKQAYEVYGASGWRLACEHVQSALGRLAGALGRRGEAARWLAAPLAAAASAAPAAANTAAQRAALRDYMLAHQHWIENEDTNELPILPLPVIDRSATSVVVAGPAPLSAPGRVPATSLSLQDAGGGGGAGERAWHRLEELLLQEASGALPMIFKPTVNLFTARVDERPAVPQGEPVQISISFGNTLKIPLVLEDTELLWKFLPAPEVNDKPNIWLSNEPYLCKGVQIENNIIVSQKIKSIVIEGDHVEVVTFSFTPMQVGQVIIVGVAFKLTSHAEGTDSSDISIVGKLPLGGDNVNVTDPFSGIPKRFQITVEPCAPCLQADRGSILVVQTAAPPPPPQLEEASPGSCLDHGMDDVSAGAILRALSAGNHKGAASVFGISNMLKCMTFTEMSPVAINGELRAYEVEFRNVGPVALHKLHVAVSHPDCLQLVTDPPAEAAADFRPLYDDKYCDPASQPGSEGGGGGGGWRARASREWGARCVRRVGGVGGAGAVLPPGAALRGARVLVRARPRAAPRAAAPCELRLLAYYEPPPPPPAAPAPRFHRLLRHVFRLQLHESIEVVTIPRRHIGSVGDAVGEKLCLMCEVKNVSEPRLPLSAEVLDVSLLSRQWRLARLVAAPDKAEPLAPREKMHLVLEGVRLPRPPELVHASTLKISSGSAESQHSICDTPYSNFVVEYKNNFIDDDEYSPSDNDGNKRGLIRSMLVVRWKSRDVQGRAVVGQTCSWIECFSKSAAAANDSLVNLEIPPPPLVECDSLGDIFGRKKKENVVFFKLEHSSEVNHDFDARKICTIPVTLHVVNCYDVPVIALVDMTKKREGGLGWVGAAGGTRVPLPALGRAQVPLQAACAAPGSYLLDVGAGLTLSLPAPAPAPTSAHTQLCSDTSLLVVHHRPATASA